MAESLQARIEPLNKQVAALAHKLSTARQAAAKKLSPMIVKELAEFVKAEMDKL